MVGAAIAAAIFSASTAQAAQPTHTTANTIVTGDSKSIIPPQ
ncbi:hypothetical protein [Kutzneria sp. NPDC052558]